MPSRTVEFSGAGSVKLLDVIFRYSAFLFLSLHLLYSDYAFLTSILILILISADLLRNDSTAMFIDTATANTRSARPYIVVEPDHVSSHCVSPHHTSPYNDSQTPLVETFINQDAPPSYLEATTPGLYTGRLSGEEGARLLSFDGREPRDTTFKEEQYRRRRLRDQCLKKRWLKGIAAIVVVVAISALGALALAAVTARRNAQVRSAVGEKEDYD